MSHIDLAALLCSRLCHDLVSPVGALSNGIEILADEHDDEMRGQVLDLLEQSASQTTNRLKFFRLAFGAAGGFGAELSMDEARDALAALLSGHKVALTWTSPHGTLDKRFVKLLLNLALVAGECLVRGGTVAVETSDGDGRVAVAVQATGERLILSESVRAAVSGGATLETLGPKSAPAYLAHLVAQSLDASLTVEEGDGSLLFKASATLGPAAL